MPKANPSTRSSGRVTLSFGLVNIPIALYTGTVSAHGVERHEYLPVPRMIEDPKGTTDADGNVILVQATKEITKDDGTTEEVPVFDDHLIGRGQTDKETGELLTVDEKAQLQKKIETEYGPVYVEDNEIERLFTLDPNTLTILSFQPQHLFYQGHYVPKGLSFIEPDKSGTGSKKAYMAKAVKLLATLYKGMKEEGVVALGELTTRGVPKPVILTPDGRLYTVYHTDALREQREFPETETVAGEVQMMRSLIGALTQNDVADLSDTRSELIQNFANEKAEAGDFGKVSDDYTAAAPVEPAMDLMAMLQASVDAAKEAS